MIQIPLWILMIATSEIYASSTSSEESLNAIPAVPDIDECKYFDALSVDCWWTRPLHDNSTKYSLSVIIEAEPLDERKKHICSPTIQKVQDDGVVKEHCEFFDAMPYSYFNVSVTTACDADSDCEEAAGRSITFYCSTEKVILRAPPLDLEVDPRHHLLTWSPPEKNNSMLTYIHNEITYKVMYKEYLKGQNVTTTEWKIWFIGNKTNFYLPTLVPGARYDVIIYAQLILPEGDAPWSQPSTTYIFLEPLAPPQDFPGEPTSTATPQGTISSTGPDASSAQPELRPGSTLRIATVTSIVLLAVIVAVLASLNMFCNRDCCCCSGEHKVPRPVLMIEMGNMKTDVNAPGNDGNDGSEEADVLSTSNLLPSQPEHDNHHHNPHVFFGKIPDTITSRVRSGQRSQFEGMRLINNLPNTVSNGPSVAFGENSSSRHGPSLRDTEFLLNMSPDTEEEAHADKFSPHFCTSSSVLGSTDDLPYSLICNSSSPPYAGSASSSLQCFTAKPNLLPKDLLQKHCFQKQNTEINMKNELNQKPPALQPFHRCSMDSTNMEYVVSDPHDDLKSCQENEKEWNMCQVPLPSQSCCGKLPDYVKHSSEWVADLSHNPELFFALTTDCNMKSMDCTDNGDVRYCDCRTMIMEHGIALRSVLAAVCPACKKKIGIHCTTTSSGSKSSEQDSNNVLRSNLQAEHDLNADRRSTSDDSVDSGYSAEVPI